MTAAAPHSGDRPITVVILAAGAGSRMRSDIAKPLHAVGGLSLLAHAMATAGRLAPTRVVVVVGHQGAAVAQAARALRPDVAIAEQAGQLGTGHAVAAAAAHVPDGDGDVVVLYADTPFIGADALARLRAARSEGAAVAVLGFETPEPGRYGRLILGADGALERIVEAADATERERAVTLCNSGVMAFEAARGMAWVAALGVGNAQGEYYLTDLVALARAEGAPCAAVICPAEQTLGVNSRADLAAAEAAFQARARAAAMADGATLVAPETVFFSHDTRLGRDVLVEPNVVFGPGVTVADGASVRAFCHIEGCEVGPGAIVGPFARLRPGATLGPGARVGNFVEIKNSALGVGAKVNHLAYVGDADVGDGANIGAGVITCNYDGARKHRTEIGADAFIGSNAALVAPVSVGAGAYVASGSVVTQNVEADALAIGRARQVVKPGFAARLRARLAGGR